MSEIEKYTFEIILDHRKKVPKHRMGNNNKI